MACYYIRVKTQLTNPEVLRVAVESLKWWIRPVATTPGLLFVQVPDVGTLIVHLSTGEVESPNNEVLNQLINEYGVIQVMAQAALAGLTARRVEKEGKSYVSYVTVEVP